MKTRIYTILTLLLILPAVAVSGQSLKGTYFSEYSPYRNKLNPAFMPRGGYFGIAAFDNIGLGLNSNLGLTSLLFPGPDGRLQTGFHPDIPAEKFLNGIPASPYLDINVDTDILGIGFFTGKYSYWNIGLGLKVTGDVDIDKNLFKFIKLGAANDPQCYNMRRMSLGLDAYIEASLGYTHDFSHWVKGLRGGIRAKFLASAGKADIKINKLDIRMGSDAYEINTDATAYLWAKGIDVQMTTDSEGKPNIELMEPNIAQLGPAGYGVAFDLGLEYRLPVNDFFDSIRFSAAFTDLGFIKYKADAMQKFTSAGSFQYNGFNLKFDDTDNLEEEMDKVVEELEALLNLQEDFTGLTAMNRRTKPQLFVGVEMPFLWNKMSLGLLYSAKFGYTATRNELTLALNARPKNNVNIGVNYSMLNTLKSIGWLIEYTPRAGINLLIGSDYTFFNITPQFIPVDQLNFNLRFGLSFALGNRFDDKALARKEKKAAKKAAKNGYM